MIPLTTRKSSTRGAPWGIKTRTQNQQFRRKPRQSSRLAALFYIPHRKRSSRTTGLPACPKRLSGISSANSCSGFKICFIFMELVSFWWNRTVPPCIALQRDYHTVYNLKAKGRHERAIKTVNEPRREPRLFFWTNAPSFCLLVFPPSRSALFDFFVAAALRVEKQDPEQRPIESS